MDIRVFDQLYKRYGYSINKKLSSDAIRIYILKKGVYFGADIVLQNEEDDCSEVVKTLSNSGYACRTKSFQTMEECENYLFDSFFHSTQLTERLQTRYNQFIKKQTETLKSDYEYIPVSYLVEGEKPGEGGSLVSNVSDKLKEKGAHLIIIEAAAGYGKTCTSFEIINNVSLKIKTLSPIFTELSRDRRASIFKHILQDVIVNEFHSLLDENLVIHEIQNGRIPLIIDGFDELLSKEQDKGNSEFEQVETMLSTIGDLLVNNAKIIITGRKTAIFSGDSFDSWKEGNPNSFLVSRYLLHPPKIEDWLEEYKLQGIKERSIPINHIANPVLLAFLRSLVREDFNSAIETPNRIVEKYFFAILDREQERQQLNIEAEEQLNIFRNLAAAMVEFDITSDSKEWIKELLLDRNFELLERIRKSYSIQQRPTIDELTNTLSNHALIDRKGNQENVGFINDFIFGTFIGECLVKTESKLKETASKHMIELATTAFQFQEIENKNSLYTIVSDSSFFTQQDKLNTEYILKGKITQQFENATFSDFNLSSVVLLTSNQFRKCVFVNCFFESVDFHNEAFFETSFVNCRFKDCEYKNNNGDGNNLINLNCIDYESGFLLTIDESIEENQEEKKLYFEDILGKFLDTASRPKHKRISSILQEFNSGERNEVSKIISKMKTDKVIYVNGDNAYLTEKGIQECKKNVSI